MSVKNPIKIFYAHSNTTKYVYDRLCEELGKLNYIYMIHKRIVEQ
jgi:hypothetical protein